MINWHDIIKKLDNGSVVTVSPERWNQSNPQYAKLLELWQSKNFNTDIVRWINYYDNSLTESIVAENLGIKCLRSWISCVEPGYMTGYHFDIDDKENEYLKHGEIKRYSIFISEPDVGHIFILGKEYYFNQPIGTKVLWKNHKEWHNGINGGLSNKYMFHILGY